MCVVFMFIPCKSFPLIVIVIDVSWLSCFPFCVFCVFPFFGASCYLSYAFFLYLLTSQCLGILQWSFFFFLSRRWWWYSRASYGDGPSGAVAGAH